MMPDDCQATFLGSSGIIFGISRLFLGYKKKPKQVKQGCFRAFNRVFVLSYVNLCYINPHSYHVNHPFKQTGGWDYWVVKAYFPSDNYPFTHLPIYQLPNTGRTELRAVQTVTNFTLIVILYAKKMG